MARSKKPVFNPMIIFFYNSRVIHIKLLFCDRLLIFGSLGNYSVAGFEMVLHRYVSHHIITYYVPSGKMTTF